MSLVTWGSLQGDAVELAAALAMSLRCGDVLSDAECAEMPEGFPVLVLRALALRGMHLRRESAQGWRVCAMEVN